MADVDNDIPAKTPVDPFDRLFKMSTTAGVGSADYVEINKFAVGSVLLGLAGGLLFFDNNLFLIFPILGVLSGVIALWAITRSNGTETGIVAAAVGLLLCLGIGGTFAARGVLNGVRQHTDEEAIATLVRTFGEHIKPVADQPDAINSAYQLCDAGFKKRVPLELFITRWKGWQQTPLFGRMVGMRWNDVLRFDEDQITGEMLADGFVLIHFERTGEEPARMRFSFRKLSSGWAVDQIDIFPSVVDKKAAPQKTRPEVPLGPPVPN